MRRAWLRAVSGVVAAGLTFGLLQATPVSAATSISAIAAGSYHTCALTAAGGVKCWGGNDYGALGNGTNDDSAVPVDVSGLTSGVTAISAGKYYACALTTAGGVKCWGYGISGTLGDGTDVSSNVPVDVSGLTSGITAISAGKFDTCALTTAGGVKCWGYNLLGQLGDGTQTNRNVPIDVIGLTSGVTAISAGGGDHTCALTTLGGAAVKCWGNNPFGALGDGTTTSSDVPVDVVGLGSGVTAISTGKYVTCVVIAGGAKCWGYGGNGQLGDGSNVDSLTPVDVVGLGSGVASISAGYVHTCARTSSGGAKCWGQDGNGALGDGTNTNSNIPVDVSGLTSGTTAISAGYEHTCARTSNGSARCWGDGYDGDIGDGTTASRNAPAPVVGLTVGAKVPKITKLKPVAKAPGMTITITGKHFTHVTAVSFNGVPSLIFSGTPLKLVVTVPLGATTGTVTVTTPGGVATSGQTFTVL